MSKLILWFGFLISIIILPFGLFVSKTASPLIIVFWLVILIGSGYKLFFSQSQK